MKLFKFIKKLFRDLRQWLIDMQFYEAVGGMAVATLTVSIIVSILGLIVEFLGIPCGTANNFFKKGTVALTVIIMMLFVCGSLWAFFKIIVRFCQYLIKVWKEL